MARSVTTRLSLTIPAHAIATIALALVLLLATIATAQDASPILAAGNGQGLWIVLAKPDPTGKEPGIIVLQRRDADTPDRVFRATERTGSLARGGLATDANRAWLVYSSGTVQSIVITRDPRYGTPKANEPVIEAGLPPKALVSLAVAGERPWALLRIEDKATLDRIDGPEFAPVATPATSPTSQPAPGTTQASSSDLAPTRTPASSQPANLPAVGLDSAASGIEPNTAPATAPVIGIGTTSFDRLVKLDAGRWVRVPLPTDWPQPSQGYLVALDDNDAVPVLVRVTHAGDGVDVATYRWRGHAWAASTCHLAGSTQVLPFAVEGQLVLAQTVTTQKGRMVKVYWPREKEPFEVCELGPIGESAVGFAVTGVGQTAALTQIDKANLITWQRVNLRGEEITPATPLKEETATPIFEMTGALVQLGSLLIALVVMFVFWRRDPGAETPKVPDGYVIADVMRRAIAGAIDLVPCVFAASLWSSTPLSELVQKGPWLQMPGEALVPGLIAIALFTLHTGITELISGRSMGKTAMGLRVRSVNGQPPAPWQIILRTLFKPLELIAWPLLFLPLVRPSVQRLGDLAARTIVIVPKPEEDDIGDDEE